MITMRSLCLVLVLVALIACGAPPSPTPDIVATQVAAQRAAAATLTAEAPAATSPPLPTAADTSTPAPSVTPTTVAPSTVAPSSTPAPTKAAKPTATNPPIEWSPDPYAVVGVASDDVLNIRAGAGVAQPIVGTIPPYGMGVQVGEDGEEVGGSLWLPVWYRGTTGWANSNYLARQVGSVDEGIAASAVPIIMAIKNQDMSALETWVHPVKGLRFSPYTFVLDEYLVFSAADIPDLLSDTTIYHWGTFEGLGEPIELTFGDYYDEFIYDADFFQPQVVGLDEAVGMGSMINNIAQFYPGAVTIEYHFEGFDPQYEGYDWLSLRLVLEEHEGSWYLVGIVHDEWTP